jgi:hypothetical protein
MAASVISGIALGVPPPKYTVSGRHCHSWLPISANSESAYASSSALGCTPEAKLQKVHFCEQNGHEM